MGACCCVSRIIDNDDEAFYSQIAEIEKLKTSDGVVKQIIDKDIKNIQTDVDQEKPVIMQGDFSMIMKEIKQDIKDRIKDYSEFINQRPLQENYSQYVMNQLKIIKGYLFSPTERFLTKHNFSTYQFKNSLRKHLKDKQFLIKVVDMMHQISLAIAEPSVVYPASSMLQSALKFVENMPKPNNIEQAVELRAKVLDYIYKNFKVNELQLEIMIQEDETTDCYDLLLELNQFILDSVSLLMELPSLRESLTLITFTPILLD